MTALKAFHFFSVGESLFLDLDMVIKLLFGGLLAVYHGYQTSKAIRMGRRGEVTTAVQAVSRGDRGARLIGWELHLVLSIFYKSGHNGLPRR